ncbi:uncharacterized protein LOC143907175 isoform X3 [Temnothorax americanus]|uniref:uncharacterized protein LOC143907175 isoform X3 n=1 Tax=Temnothorax americanus TaxID=1964332 RepID=UPI0040695A10
MKHARVPRTMWKGKGLSKAAGQCNGLQDYGFCDLKDCKAIQSFRRDVRSITGATYKGMLKRLISELRARGGAPDSEDDVRATSHFERRILRYLHISLATCRFNKERSILRSTQFHNSAVAHRPPPRRKFQRYSYSGGPGVLLSRSKMSCLPDLPCRCPQMNVIVSQQLRCCASCPSTDFR